MTEYSILNAENIWLPNKEILHNICSSLCIRKNFSSQNFHKAATLTNKTYLNI